MTVACTGLQNSMTPPTAPTPKTYEVTIWAPYLSVLERQTLIANAELIAEVNPVWYELTSSSEIAGSVQSPAAFDEARTASIRVVPSLVNGGFDRDRVAAIIHDPARRAQHVAEIVALVVDNDFDGIDVDYESLFPEDRDAFSLFIEELAHALHAQDKLLSVAVHAKRDDEGSWAGPQAQDWARLGAAVDEFKIMTYDFHYSTSEAGPIAPLDWIDEVLSYAATVVPPEKTYVGIHFYGYDWIGATGTGVVWREAIKLADMHGVEIMRDESGEAWFNYGPDNRRTVYFTDARSIETRLADIITHHPDLAGIAIWRLGGEDPDNWGVIKQRLHQVSD